MAAIKNRKIGTYAGPTLIIHGTRDSIIPLADAEALYKASGSARKKLLRISEADHNNLLAMGCDEYLQAVADLVRSEGTAPKAK